MENNAKRGVIALLAVGVLLALTVAVILIRHPGTPPTTDRSAKSKEPPRQRSLPSECFMNAKAERGTDGAIYIVGSTNLPDGLHLGITLLNGAHHRDKYDATDDVYVESGTFRSKGLLHANRPYPPGKHEVYFNAFFEALFKDPKQDWQSPDVLAVIGAKGEKLHGAMIKKTDPDVIDSPQMLDYTLYPVLPPLSEETKAIELVKTNGAYSARDIEHVIEFYMLPGGGTRPGKGWSAKLTGKQTYAVSFDFITDDKEGEHQAIWSVDLSTRKVSCTNMAAKSLN